METQRACADRGYQSLLWLARRPEKRIACVSHGGILAMTLGDPGHTCVRAGAGVQRRFGNCELRSCALALSAAEDGAGPPVVHVTMLEDGGAGVVE